MAGNSNGIYVADQGIGITKVREGEEPEVLVKAGEFDSLIKNYILGFVVSDIDEFYVYMEEEGKVKIMEYGLK